MFPLFKKNPPLQWYIDLMLQRILLFRIDEDINLPGFLVDEDINLPVQKMIDDKCGYETQEKNSSVFREEKKLQDIPLKKV